MKTTDLAALLTLVEERAPKLRAAGVNRISIGGDLHLELAPPDVVPEEPTLDLEAEAAAEAAKKGPLFDPDTFGGRPVPGRRGEDTDA